MNDYEMTVATNMMELDFYRMKRYSIPISIAVVESKCENLFEIISNRSLRKTDIFQFLGDNKFLIIFGATHHQQSEIAISNLFNEIKQSCMQHIFIGITEVLDTDSSSETTLRRVNVALKMARKLSNKDIIVI
ncbi:MAG: hypothetical protein DRH57_08535 [Candidatus Cloacimonadota bacterium]|nr:MAG: hypothetical protein DRH57_08535 [Candidatus Cloacimonadota bacterium]